MKFTATLLLAAALQVSAKSYSQQITLSVKDVPLEQAFNAIHAQTGYSIVYNFRVMKGAKNVSLQVDKASIEEVLQICFKDQPLTYTVIDKTIIVKPREVIKSDEAPPAFAPPGEVKGYVSSENGPISGASVIVKRTGKGSSTNLKGEFTLTQVDENDVLVITSIGYERQEIAVKDTKGYVIVQLKVAVNKLDEIRIIAYGTTTKRANTGDVTTVSSKTIQQYPTTDVLDALQGTVPGLNIYKSTGNPNGTYKVQLRGINGLKGAAPLYVVDGIPYQGGSFNTQNNYLGGNTAFGSTSQGYDALGFINPADIESISVLKDADATSIYGSRGADGVILITTKKGNVGDARIDVSSSSGVTHVGHMQPLLNLQQYLQMRHEAKANDNSAISASDYDINGTWDTTHNTDWQKELIGGNGHFTNAQLGISGGSRLMQYRISGGYNRTANPQPMGGTDQSANLHLSLGTTTANNKFSILFTGGYLYDVSNIPQSDLTVSTFMAPDAPSLYTSDGRIDAANTTILNPLLSKNYINKSPHNNLLSSVVFSYRPISNWEIKFTTGYNRQEVNEFLGSPTTVFPSWFPPILLSSSANFTYDINTSWSVEPQINYNKVIGKGKLSATIGASLQSQGSSVMQLRATGYSSDLLLSSISAGSSITSSIPYSFSPRKFGAAFGRVSYSWADKYYINVTGRDDGSSNFGENKQFHGFAAVGAGWVFSEESFIKKNLPVLSFGKLRGSYGSTGRDNVAPYSFLSTYSLVGGTAYQGTPGVAPSRLPNPDLSWETTRKAELGLELQFLKGRIDFESNVYRNRTTGALTGAPLSLVSGFSSITENFPAVVQNQGFDIVLRSTNIDNANFTWSTTVVFTHDKNTLLSYPNLATSSYNNTYVIGQPVNIVRAYKYAGVNPQTGIYQFYTAKGTITPTPTGDIFSNININPAFYGSVQNSFRYKLFSLGFLFRFIKQSGRNAFYNIGGLPPGYGSNNNFSTIVLSRWQKPGDLTDIQRYGTNFALYTSQYYAVHSDFAYSDASFIRLQNVSLSYKLPPGLTQKLGIKSSEFFLLGENLLTITGYKGIDPETQSGFSLPPLRTLTAGLRLTL